MTHRRETTRVDIGGVAVGSSEPVVVQSMTNTDTADVDATTLQVAALAHAGSELVRITVNNDSAARAVPLIRRKLDDLGIGVPLIGDFHYNGHQLLPGFPDMAAALAKYRINPGNVGSKRRDENFSTIIETAIEHHKPVRIGVNWGSLDQDLLTRMMDANARSADPLDTREVMIEAMINSALRSAELAESVGIPPENIFRGRNGLPLEVGPEGASFGEEERSGIIFVDGIELADPNDASLRDRRTISGDGIVVIVATIAADDGEVVVDPEIISRGIVALDEEIELNDELKDLVEDSLEKAADARVRNHDLIQSDLHDAVAGFIHKRLKRRPMVVPVVVEV